MDNYGEILLVVVNHQPFNNKAVYLVVLQTKWV